MNLWMSRSRVKEEEMSNQRPRSEFTDVDKAENPSDFCTLLRAL